jgi:hypothetical protein
MDKLKEAEALVDALLLDQFNPSMKVSNAMGNFNVGWTQCYETRCSGQELKFDKDLCKQGCIITSASSAISEIAGSRSMCGELKTPSSCIKRLDKGVERLRKKIIKARENQRKIRDKKAKYLASVGGGG